MWEWDPAKELRNRLKHGVAFVDAVGVLEDLHAITVDQHVDEELRHVTIGMDTEGRVLVVVYTRRGERIRIISARKANTREVRQYEG